MKTPRPGWQFPVRKRGGVKPASKHVSWQLLKIDTHKTRTGVTLKLIIGGKNEVRKVW